MGPGEYGILVELFGWTSLFWLTALAMIIPFGLLLSVPCDWAEAKGDKYDFGGAALWVLALSLGFVGLTRLLEPSGLLMLAGGLVMDLFFAWRQLKAARPMLDLQLFIISRRFTWASLAAFAASIFLLSLYLQYIKGLSPKTAGFYLMLQPAVQALLIGFLGALVSLIKDKALTATDMSPNRTAIEEEAIWQYADEAWLIRQSRDPISRQPPLPADQRCDPTNS